MKIAILRKGKIAEVVIIAHQVILTKVLFDPFLKYTFWRQRYEDGLRTIKTRRDSNISRKDIGMKKRNRLGYKKDGLDWRTGVFRMNWLWIFLRH